jgi:hypothetical protein
MRRAAVIAAIGLGYGCTAGPDPMPVHTADTATAGSTPSLEPLERITRLVRADAAPRLVVHAWVPDDIDVPGDPWARLVALLQQVTDKPGGITVEVEEIPLPAAGWTFADLGDELDSRRAPYDVEVATIDVLAVHGDYLDTDAPVLGLGWGWSDIALFIDPITDACTETAGGNQGAGRIRICEATWAALLRHEAGHVLGLVNHELPMVTDHEDPAHEHHDPDPDCLMYWAWDQSDLSGKVADEDLELCAASLADLAALREGPATR